MTNVEAAINVWHTGGRWYWSIRSEGKRIAEGQSFSRYGSLGAEDAALAAWSRLFPGTIPTYA